MPEITAEQLTSWIEHARYPDLDESRAMAHEVLKLRQLLAELVELDDCDFDHHGGCQAHGYLSLEPGQLCPQAEAKQWLASVDREESDHA